jgi:predicted phage tail protein
MTATVAETLATLTWQPPNAGGAPTHYLVYVGTSPGASNLVNAYNVGNTLRVQGHLTRGTYYARVRAVNDAGISLNSTEARFQVGRRLATPTSFRLQWVGTTVIISWTAPSGDTAEDVPTNYVLEAGTSPGTKDAAVMRVGNVTSISANVSTGTYYVRVRAENPYGESDPTEDLEVRAPGSPQNPTGLVNYGTGSVVDLRWEMPAAAYPATGFIIEAGSASGLADLATLQVGDVRRFVTNAPPGVYYVRVRAVNARGRSGPSNEIRIIKE